MAYSTRFYRSYRVLVIKEVEPEDFAAWAESHPDKQELFGVDENGKSKRDEAVRCRRKSWIRRGKGSVGRGVKSCVKWQMWSASRFLE